MKLYHLAVARDQPLEPDHGGFVHLSTWDELPVTLELHFGEFDRIEVIQVEIDPEDVNLVWEEVRGRESAMPHYYGVISHENIKRGWTLTQSAAGWDLSAIEG